MNCFTTDKKVIVMNKTDKYLIKKVIAIIILCLLVVSNVNSQVLPPDYDYADVFDRVIRSRFDIQTNRRLDLKGLNPYNVYKVVQEGNFIFFIGDENGVFAKQEDKDRYYRAPENPKFEECLRLVARMYQKDVEIPYTFPVFINYKNCGGTAYCYSGRLKGVQEGKSSTWAGLIIDVDIEKNENVHYTLEDGELYEGLYLAEVIAHEIFHSVFWNERDHKVYPYSWISDEPYEYKPGYYRYPSDDLGLVTHFYSGENAMMANGGQPIQLYVGHFSNAFWKTDDKFYAYNWRDNRAVNHLGKVSLGIMKDVGFKLKPGVDIRCDKYTGYLFDDTEQIWAQVLEGDTLYVLEDKIFDNGQYYPIWKSYSDYTSNEIVMNNKYLDVRVKDRNILIVNNGPETEVFVYDLSGRLVDRKIVNTGNMEIRVGLPGIYIVKSKNYSKKFFCP